MNRNAEYAAGLRKVADFLEAHPDLPEFNPPDIGVHITDRQEFLSAVRTMKGQKDYTGDYFQLVRRFVGGVTLRVQSFRTTVCDRVVTGTHEVEIPDPNAPKIKVTREKVEWRCDPLALLGEEAEVEEAGR